MTLFRPYKRTDLASELLKSKSVSLGEYVDRTDVTVDKAASERIGKPQGNYTTIVSPVVYKGQREYYRRLEKALSSALSDYLPTFNTCLVIGLGNPSMTADALGKSVVERVGVTRGIEEGKKAICTLCPNVLGVTGIESFDVISGVVQRVKPDVILAVDSLCAAAPERLCTAFQITDTGIAPGSGVSNFRFRIDKNTMSTPVISLGVPLVIYSSTLSGDENNDTSDLIVTPKDVDILVEECAEIIAAAINTALS